ncbi:hypothetical protein BDW59DRAFT_93122 [Aspergillus cavernicola]|uniref:Secreted protein n=1 Tax=Aspergillus cavernicola TaxID=176166 RepID=A0ABR4IYI6_9EURO
MFLFNFSTVLLMFSLQAVHFQRGELSLPSCYPLGLVPLLSVSYIVQRNKKPSSRVCVGCIHLGDIFFQKIRRVFIEPIDSEPLAGRTSDSYREGTGLSPPACGKSDCLLRSIYRIHDETPSRLRIHRSIPCWHRPTYLISRCSNQEIILEL